MQSSLRSIVSGRSALVAGAAVLALTSASQAAITVFTTLAAFNAATTAPGTDTYAGFSITSSTPTPVNRSAGAYTYTANATPNGMFFGGGTATNPFLSTNTATDTITLNNYGGGAIAGAGGNFFASDINGVFLAGSVIVTATDSTAAVSVQTIAPTSATAGSFLGFVSTGTMTSITVSAVQPAGAFSWPSVDNFVLARAVPEPASMSMLAAAGTALLRRRR